jgi:dihydroorotate dehydrogenase (fumarate)
MPQKNFLVEINLSCPNIPEKPPIAFDFVGMKEYLTTVFAAGTHGIKVGVKLTPYFYDGQFVEAAGVLNEFYPNLTFVTSINTVGCGLVGDVETEAPVLASADASYGGLGGPAVHATALGNVSPLVVWCSSRHGGECLIDSWCRRFRKD